jgi:hypothetical protein
LICSPSAKKSGEARKQAGKKEGGLGEGIFARLRFPRRRRGWESIRKILWILLKVGSDFVQQTPLFNLYLIYFQITKILTNSSENVIIHGLR